MKYPLSATSDSKLITYNKGFTLIEVMVAFAIFAILLATLYSAFFLSHRAVDAVDESLIQLQESRAALDTMKKELESSLFSKDKAYTLFKLKDRDFHGRQASQLDFTAFSNLLPGVSKINYIVDEDKGKLILKKNITSAYTQSPGYKIKEDKPKYIDLIENLEAFTVEAKYKEKWVKTWDGSLNNDIPEEIRISLKIITKKNNGANELFTISDTIKPRIGKPV